VLGEPRPAEDPTVSQYIAVRRWASLLERADLAVNMPAFGLALGASVGAAQLGLLGYLTRHCATVGQALARTHKYQRLVYETNPGRMRFDFNGVAMEWGTELGRPGQLADECALAMGLTYGREVSGLAKLTPTEVCFVNPPPPSLQPYLDFFGCPVSFDASRTIFRLPYSVLARRLPQHEPTLMALLEQQARERMNRLQPTDPLLASLRATMAKLLPEGKATLLACALRLHCSPRTLQRKLLTRDVNFQTLLDEVRMQLADTYMADPRLKLAEVALLLGFADQATFTHAFTRWTGMPPARWRARMHQIPDSAPAEL
jgi:AraC-like DNA-binding protein